MKTMTQEFQVIEKMREEGGYATLRRLNEVIDFSAWKTKTPEASVRRIVQYSKEFFRIQPGLWALKEMREQVLKKLSLKMGDQKSEERFSHGSVVPPGVGRYFVPFTALGVQALKKRSVFSWL